jgi:hypothetical protein
MSDPDPADGGTASSRRSARAEPAVGMCAVCAHARPITSDRGSTFWLCGLAATDARFPKYPRLPVVRCAGCLRSEGSGSPRDAQHPGVTGALRAPRDVDRVD